MISIIIPTLGSRELELKRLLLSIEQQTYQQFEIIVVSQGNHDHVEELINSSLLKDKIKQIKLTRKGLSHSRNEGLKHVSGEIITFSDDDCWYPKDSFENIKQYFEENKQNGICTFQIYDPDSENYYKDYSDKAEENVSFRGLFRKSSIELFLNLKVVKKADLKFDESFGLGAKYPSGEENIFLIDLLKKGYKISYVPKIVVYHPKKESTEFLSAQQFIGKGPMFKRIYNTPLAFLYFIAFFIKKFNMLEKPFVNLIKGLGEILQFKTN